MTCWKPAARWMIGGLTIIAVSTTPIHLSSGLTDSSTPSENDALWTLAGLAELRREALSVRLGGFADGSSGLGRAFQHPAW